MLGKHVESPDADGDEPAPRPKTVAPTAPKPPVIAKPPDPPPKPPKPGAESGPALPIWKAPVHTAAPSAARRGEVAVFAPEELVGSKEQGVAASYSGTLRISGAVYRRPSPYCLIDFDGRGRGVTQCYILGSSAQLAALLGGRMRVEGTEYWVQGVRHPVLVPKRIYRKN